MNRNTVFNLILFVILSAAVLGGWWWVEKTFFPPPPAPEPAEPPPPKQVMPPRETILAVAGGGVAGSTTLNEWPTAFRPEVPTPEKPPEPKPVDTTPHRLIALSGEGYNLRVLLSNKGAGVQQVVIPAFDQTTREGTKATDENGNHYLLELIPGYFRPVDRTTVRTEPTHYTLAAGEVDPTVPLTRASYTLLHYTDPDAAVPRPSDELTTRKWELVSSRSGTDAEPGEAVFETTLGAPYFVRIRKTFTLAKTDFHVRMKLEFSPADGWTDKAPEFVYQIVGPRNMPIEGEWYSPVLRNAVFGYKNSNGYAGRAIQDSAHITTEHGSIKFAQNSKDLPGAFTFAAVLNQFFAAAIAIDPEQPQEVRTGLWQYARATREWQTHPNDGKLPDSMNSPEAFYTDKPQLGDITVRVRANPLKLSAAAPVEHKYWLYHGPTKVRLLKTLGLLDQEHQGYSTDPTLVDDQYIGALGLNVMTDAASPNWFGQFASFIRWTDLVVWFTNRMHDILGWMHGVVPVWGLNVLMLTVLVRLILLVPSRRQQAGMIKMQEKMAAMKPELEKLQEKYKGDPQRLNQEKTRLMLQHGVNPLSSMGGCLLMFAQMPVFLGLYFCLQESIFFRLDSFLWIKNLAAPDMLFPWSESIPFVSTADQMGHSWYLGPFVNILPLLAVSLMYLNIKISSPPPTDEQQEMQQRMMKFMMLFMGVFFYKMAAGLCLYFICSTLWGITERKLLKRKKKATEEGELITGPSAPSLNGQNKPATPPKPPGFMGRLMERIEEAQREAQQKQIVNNPQQKPPGGGNPPGGKGKKRRKK